MINAYNAAIFSRFLICDILKIESDVLFFSFANRSNMKIIIKQRNINTAVEKFILLNLTCIIYLKRSTQIYTMFFLKYIYIYILI